MTRGPHHGRLDRAEPLANPVRVRKEGVLMSRSLAAAAAMLVCLALGGMPVLAQEAGSQPPGGMVFVTGTEACGARSPFQMKDDPNGVTTLRGAAATCSNNMSDPRVSGAWLNTMDMDCYGDGFCLLSGTHVLDEPEGGWDCSWVSSNFPVADEDYVGDWPYLIIGVCPGTGGYEWLTFVFQHTDQTFPGDTSFHGVIYEGSPIALLGGSAE